MSIKSENKNSEISMNMNNFGMAMEKLAIIRWINVPFQAIISLFIILFQIPNINRRFDYFDYELIWIPLVFGILYVFVSLSTFLRFLQYLVNLWSLGKNLKNPLIKKASIYQLIRIGLYGFIIILSVFLGILILIPYYQFFSYNPEIVHIQDVAHIPEFMRYPSPNFNFITIFIVSLLILFFIVVMKVFNILSIVSIDNWAERQKLINPSNDNIHQINSGTNLMKIAVFLELVNILFGSIFFNIGLAKASQGFKKYSYQFSIDINEFPPRFIPSSKIQPIKNIKEPKKFPIQLQNSIQMNIKNENHIKFCSYCGANKANNDALYCFNCGSKYLDQFIK